MLHQFYKNSPSERRQILASQTGIAIETLAGDINEETPVLDRMSENVIGSWRLPLGLLTGLTVNSREHCVAMATEEPSVIAAVNRSAIVFNAAGGVHAFAESPVTCAQVMCVVATNAAESSVNLLMARRDSILEIANKSNPGLQNAGGGAFTLDIDITPCGAEKSFIVLRLHVHTIDAMGANAVNTMAEAVQNEIGQWLNETPGFERGMAILTNRAPGRRVTATVDIPEKILQETAREDDAHRLMHRIELASRFAEANSERAVTHNKGIMNGIIAAAIPLGQDTRAMQSAFYDAACSGQGHAPMAQWRAQNGLLTGRIELPLVVGLVGGIRQIPAVNEAFELAGIQSYRDLCGILAAIGLAQNFGALRALMTDGIQAGHMTLHARKAQTP